MSRIQTVELKEGQTGNIVVADLAILRTKHVEDYEQVWREPLRELNEEDKTLSWRFKKQLAERHPYQKSSQCSNHSLAGLVGGEAERDR